MIEKISAPVSVGFVFESESRKMLLKWLVWNGRMYPILKIGLHHTYRRGRTLYHVFSVSSRTLFFRLVFNTDSLHWRLEEISDGLPN